MNYRNVNRVTGSKAPAYFLGRPRSFYRDETAPAVPLSVVWDRFPAPESGAAKVVAELQFAA
jgi:hypothetical protein